MIGKLASVQKNVLVVQEQIHVLRSGKLCMEEHVKEIVLWMSLVIRMSALVIYTALKDYRVM